MEGQTLYNLVIGRNYNAELRNEMLQLGIKRISNLLFISKATATKYELILKDEGENRVVVGVDAIEKDSRTHLTDPNAKADESKADESPEVLQNISIHHKTVAAMQRQVEISYYYYDLIDRWNGEMYEGTALGQQLRELVKQESINWENFIFLPDPLASGEYVFGAIHEGKAASIHSWLDLPDGRFIVPTNGTPDGAFDSLECGMEFHAWEFQSFDTPAAAGQYAIKLINNSNTTYAQAIRKLLGKENGKVTRNDFHRNIHGEMCRVEVIREDRGIRFNDVPVVPTVADCIDCLLAPYIRSNALAAVQR